NGCNHIAGFHPGFFRRTFGDDLANERAGRLPFELHRFSQLGSEWLHRCADVAANNATLFAQTLHHVASEIRRNGEANALASTASAENRGVNAQQPALGIDKRTAGVAHVNGRIGLDEILVIDDAHAAAADGTDDSHGDRLPQAEWIAECEHYVA